MSGHGNGADGDASVLSVLPGILAGLAEVESWFHVFDGEPTRAVPLRGRRDRRRGAVPAATCSSSERASAQFKAYRILCRLRGYPWRAERI